MFSEVKDHEDAVTAVDAKRVKLDAENAAINLKSTDLKEMAALYGNFDPDDAKKMHYLLERAGADPSGFLELYNSPDRSPKALLLKAISLKIVKKRGSLHIWENETIGASEDMAISKLMQDTEMFEALKQACLGKRK